MAPIDLNMMAVFRHFSTEHLGVQQLRSRILRFFSPCPFPCLRGPDMLAAVTHSYAARMSSR